MQFYTHTYTHNNIYFSDISRHLGCIFPWTRCNALWDYCLLHEGHVMLPQNLAKLHLGRQHNQAYDACLDFGTELEHNSYNSECPGNTAAISSDGQIILKRTIQTTSICQELLNQNRSRKSRHMRFCPIFITNNRTDALLSSPTVTCDNC